MFKKIRFLTSVSVLASMVMTQAVQAMDLADERSIQSSKRQTSTTQNTNSLYYSLQNEKEEDDSLKHPLTCISEDASTYFQHNINEKLDSFWKLRQQIIAGNYDELAGEVIESLIATLAGETKKNLFGKSNKEFDPEVLRKASKNLVDKFLKYLSINKDLYGETADGTRVTIYNKSLFKMIAKQYFPETPLTGIAITVLDNDHLKDFLTNKLIETVYGYLHDSLEKQGITVKENLGQQVVKFGRSMIYDESTVDYKELWAYLSPHINPLLRDYMGPLVNNAKNMVIKNIEADLWKLAVGATGGASGSLAASAMYFAVGPILSAAGSYMGNPILTFGGYVLGSFIGSASVGASVGAYGSLKADAYFYATKEYINKYLKVRLPLLVESIVPYTHEEYVLYKLNPNPTDIEKGLYDEDYKLLTKLNEQTYINSIGNFLKTISGIPFLANWIYSEDGPIMKPTYCDHEEQEQARRRLMRLKIENPEEATAIEENLKKFPSYALRMKRLNHSKKIGLDDINSEKIQVQKDVESLTDIVTKTRKAAATLSELLYNQYKLSSPQELRGIFESSKKLQTFLEKKMQRLELLQTLSAKDISENLESQEYITASQEVVNEIATMTKSLLESSVSKTPSYGRLIKDLLTTATTLQEHLNNLAKNEGFLEQESKKLTELRLAIEQWETTEKPKDASYEECVRSFLSTAEKLESCRNQMINSQKETSTLLSNFFQFQKELQAWVKREELDNPFYEALIKEVELASIESQDYFIDWIQKADLKDLFNKYAEEREKNNNSFMSYVSGSEKKLDYTDLFEKNNLFVNKPLIKNFIEWLMAKSVQPHIETDRKDYITKYKDSINDLLSNSLTKKMDLAQIVYLHKRHMSTGQNSIFGELPTDMRYYVLNFLDDEALGKLATYSPEFYPLSWNIIDKRKADKIFDIKILDNEDTKYFNHYCRDMLMMKAAHDKLVLDHKAYTLFRTLREHLKQTNVWDKLKNDCLRQLYFKINVTEETVFDLYEIILNKSKEFGNASDIIDKILGRTEDNEFGDEKKLTCLYDALLADHITTNVSNIFNELNGKANKLGSVEGNKHFKELCFSSLPQTEKSSGLFGWGSTPVTTSTLTYESVLETYSSAQTKLEPHDKDSDGARTFLFWKKLAGRDHSTVATKDYIIIHKEIFKNRLIAAHSTHQDYVEKYKNEVDTYKLNTPLFRNKLFFDYKDLIAAMQKQHEAFLKKLFDL